MIDLHSHILPGLDDGASDIDDSVEIARAAAADGTTVIAATPHVREDYPTSPDAMERALAEVRAAVTTAGVDIEVLPGGEIALEELDTRSLDELRRFGLGGNPAYLLLETPYSGWPLSLPNIVFRLTAGGITPIIGHPERNLSVQNNVSLLSDLVEAGALVQVTAAAVDGRLGARTRSCAFRLFELDLAHLVASDAHSAQVREVGLAAARTAIGDDALARWLTEAVPKAIVRGEPLPPRPPRLPRRRGLARLFGR